MLLVQITEVYQRLLENYTYFIQLFCTDESQIL